MTKRKILLAILIPLIFLSIALPSIIVPLYYRYTFTDEPFDDVETYTTVILIEEREDFSKNGFTGSGSEANPFVLENVEINTIKDCAIAIFYATSCFIITNCTLSSKLVGIYISTSSVSYGIISNNEITLNKRASNKELSACIAVHDTNKIQIINNYCNSLFTIGRGMRFDFSDFLTIHNNTLTNSASSLSAVDSIHLSFKFNTLLNHPYNSKFVRCEDITFSNNFITTGSDSFVEFSHCNSILLNNNSFVGDGWGISSNFCFGLNVIYNLFNTQIGITIQPENNATIHHNNFILFDTYYSHIECLAIDHSIDEVVWYDQLSLEGNYWSDLIWASNATYPIFGSFSHEDPYPLEFPVNL